MQIRKAELGDAQGIAKVHVDSWRTTYKDIIPEDYLNNLSYEQRTKLWKKNITREDSYVVIAENKEGQIIGFADARRKENNEVRNSCDLTSIYLLENYQGIGIGKKLFKDLFMNFKQKGFEEIFVEVLEENKTRFFL
jgi:L-amino acid N-acyltransferase YncA